MARRQQPSCSTLTRPVLFFATVLFLAAYDVFIHDQSDPVRHLADFLIKPVGINDQVPDRDPRARFDIANFGMDSTSLPISDATQLKPWRYLGQKKPRSGYNSYYADYDKFQTADTQPCTSLVVHRQLSARSSQPLPSVRRSSRLALPVVT